MAREEAARGEGGERGREGGSGWVLKLAVQKTLQHPRWFPVGLLSSSLPVKTTQAPRFALLQNGSLWGPPLWQLLCSSMIPPASSRRSPSLHSEPEPNSKSWHLGGKKKNGYFLFFFFFFQRETLHAALPPAQGGGRAGRVNGPRKKPLMAPVPPLPCLLWSLVPCRTLAHRLPKAASVGDHHSLPSQATRSPGPRLGLPAPGPCWGGVQLGHHCRHGRQRNRTLRYCPRVNLE